MGLAVELATPVRGLPWSAVELLARLVMGFAVGLAVDRVVGLGMGLTVGLAVGLAEGLTAELAVTSRGGCRGLP